MTAPSGKYTFARPSKPPRSDRVASQLKEELATLIVCEMKDPRVQMATVSQVKLAHDMSSARVMVSALGDEVERHRVVLALRHAEGFLRAELGHRLENLKYIPHLRFELDESAAYAVRISSMLRDLTKPHESDGQAQQDPQ